MKVGIIQSNFLPWRGYFDFIREVDFIIIHDDLQYTKGDWKTKKYNYPDYQQLSLPSNLMSASLTCCSDARYYLESPKESQA